MSKFSMLQISLTTFNNFVGRGGGRGGFNNSYNQGPPAEVVGNIFFYSFDLVHVVKITFKTDQSSVLFKVHVKVKWSVN